MNKYLQIARTSWQSSFAYKWNFILTSFMNILRIVAEVVFWSIFFNASGRDSIGGYTFSSMVTYYIFMYMISTFTNLGGVGSKVAGDIKSGRLNQFIVKPVSYAGYYFAESISQKLLQAGIALVVFIPVFIVSFHTLDTNIRLYQIPIFIAVMILSFVLSYLVNIAIGLVAFWFTELTSFFFLKDILIGFISGSVIPVDILPGYMTRIFGVLPFMYTVYFPVSILNKGSNASEILAGIGMQIFWISALYIAIKLLWKYGKRLYNGTGI